MYLHRSNNAARRFCLHFLLSIGLLAMFVQVAQASTLDEVKKAGVLRHLGIPYANFVIGIGHGMDVELVQRFAESLGVKYEYVKTDWSAIFGDLTGGQVTAKGDDAIVGAAVPIRGDIAANGVTILAWRKKVVDFSIPTFPNQVWLVARSDFGLEPIKPTGDLEKDIAATRRLLENKSVLGKVGTCLDPALYQLEKSGARVQLFEGGLNELVPALLNKEADLTLLDVPDALVGLAKWPGQVKILGPLTPPQEMGVAFPKNAPELLEAFNTFLRKCMQDGSYKLLLLKYYPLVLDYFPDFGKQMR